MSTQQVWTFSLKWWSMNYNHHRVNSFMNFILCYFSPFDRINFYTLTTRSSLEKLLHAIILKVISGLLHITAIIDRFFSQNSNLKIFWLSIRSNLDRIWIESGLLIMISLDQSDFSNWSNVGVEVRLVRFYHRVQSNHWIETDGPMMERQWRRGWGRDSHLAIDLIFVCKKPSCISLGITVQQLRIAAVKHCVAHSF